MEKEKKPTASSSKIKKAINISIIALQAVIMVVCIVFSIFIIINNSKDITGELKKGINVMPVVTESMTGDKKDSFNAGDLIFVRKVTSDEELQALKVGDIVTFKQGMKDGKYIYLTHRIIELAPKEETAYKFVTQGDYAENFSNASKEYIHYGDISGVYTGKMPKAGSVILFLQKPLNFFFIVMTPLILLLIYNVVIIIRSAMAAKYKKIEENSKTATEQAIALALAGLKGANGKETNSHINSIDTNSSSGETMQNTTLTDSIVIDEESIKRKAVEEYLALQNKKQLEAQLAREEELKQQAIAEYLAKQNKTDKE